MIYPHEFILHLSLVQGIGPAVIAAILNTKIDGFSAQDLYDCSAADIVRIFGFSPSTAQLLVDGLANKKMLDDELSYIARSGVSVVMLGESSYSELLKEIHLPPVVLYVKGAALSEYTQAVAIVGARKANNYGKRVIDSFVPELVEHNIAIVSGGAYGADSFAHQAALQAGGKTIVVFGSGLLRPYPLSNKKLFDAVVANGGSVVSCFPLTMQALPGHFPARNRIISGLAQATLVVQAAAKSGSLITADFALNQGRDVFAVPGPIDDELSSGCHALIGQGAHLAASASDILKHFGYETVAENAKKQNVKKSSQNKDISAVCKTQNLSDPVSRIINHCTQASSFDELLVASGLNFVELQSSLFDLQIEQRITQNAAGLWERI